LNRDVFPKKRTRIPTYYQRNTGGVGTSLNEEEKNAKINVENVEIKIDI